MVLYACINQTLLLLLFLSAGSAESFTVGAVSNTLHVGVPFNIPLQIKDAYNHLTVPPPELKPVLECRWVTSVFLVELSASL